MFLSGLSLSNFRNYTNKTFLFHKPLTLVIAPNASGKTNLLEAIHLLSTGESFRSGTVDDFIQVEKELARIKLRATDYSAAGSETLTQHGQNDQDDVERISSLSTKPESIEIEILLNHGLVSGKRVSKKIYSLNNVRKQKRSVVGLVPTIAFIPEDLRLITGSPSRRREFLDTLLVQIDRDYLSSLSIYEQTLRRRNKLLQAIREGESPRSTLSYWNLSLLKHGMYLQKKRAEVIGKFNGVQFPLQFQVQYDLSLINEAKLNQYADQEIAAGHTLVGPHKDDIIVKLSLVSGQWSVSNAPTTSNLPPTTMYPLFTHGSRGQQRMGVLWLKLGAFQIIEQTLHTPPILLLDDIFSELDLANRQRVLDLAKTTQTIMTSAEPEPDLLQMKELENADIIRL